MRSEIIKFLERELVGPDPDAPLVQDNGEEILENDPPTVRYGAGVLFPQETVIVESTFEDPTETVVFNNEDIAITETTPDTAERSEVPSLNLTKDSDTEESIGLANAFKPSAMGISFLAEISEGDSLCVEIKAGKYTSYSVESAGRRKQRYLRKPIFAEVKLDSSKLIGNEVKAFTEIVTNKEDGNTVNLELYVLSRPETSLKGGGESRLITVSLINKNESPGGRVASEDCFFQTSFSIRELNGKSCFVEYPEKKGERLDEEEKALKLLYRHRKTFAVGHGCAADWEDNKNRASLVQTSVLPVYDVKPILPVAFGDIDLSMLDLSDLRLEKDPITVLRSLCNKYKEWIADRKDEVNTIEKDLQPIANKHLQNCDLCLQRMQKGVEVLANDKIAMKAFRLMNRAMLLQQLHYSLELREWQKDDSDICFLPPVKLPDVHGNLGTKGKWRPFQLAFILINIASIVDPYHSDRNIADLIWFPTGGGKTEAYLGLTALTLFLRRLKKSHNGGVSILMRYTLRLLTAQQFQRAATLICACEIIRRELPQDLGDIRFSIGLWVGKSLTPNDRKDAISSLDKISRGEQKINPFVVLKCPWCGAQMGLTKECGVKGYKSYGSPKTVNFVCPEEKCSFNKKEFSLPLYVIDEDIYEYKPSLIIGTVDKFAMLPWKRQVKNLFAKDNSLFTPPELIIQDELHLISGPLGSMVGHYETVIDELCTDYSGKAPVVPKIIASTATIRRAEEQVSALFNRKVFQFPPQALEAGNSFFAEEDDKAEGRTYVGVHASALSSHVTTQVRVFSSLLQAGKSVAAPDDKVRDFYYTLLCYFNNLRELGHAATLIHADIPEYMNTTIWKKNYISPDERRFIKRELELTSREDSGRITKALQDLERNLGAEEPAVDICLSTNMISVGVDISRLGLMIMVGQPKTTSEYIQATSRVGRDAKGPGLVITIYNTGKPRDRSHYEHYRTYHSTLYKQVEPTSVTPWAIPVRRRALHALMVSIIRILGTEGNAAYPNPLPDDELIEKAYEIIKSRVEDIDSEEAKQTLKEAKDFMKKWEDEFPEKYGDFGVPDKSSPLMYPAGKIALPSWGGRGLETPSSMRSVDKTCRTIVLKNNPLVKVETEDEE